MLSMNALVSMLLIWAAVSGLCFFATVLLAMALLRKDSALR